MATFVYRHIHTNQMVYVPTLEFAGNPDWELISGGGSGGDATVVQADLDSHKGSSTSVHGIPNTNDLETKPGAQAKADAAAAASVPTLEKGAPGGVATLDGSSKLPSAQLPAISASTITTGTLPVGQIPGLPGSAITSGMVAYARLPVGTGPSSVAAGDDGRIIGAASAFDLSAHAGASDPHASYGKRVALVISATGNYTTLAAALTAVGSTPTDIIASSGITLAANTTIPANVDLFVSSSGSIALSTFNLTVNGRFSANRHSVFTGTGAVTFNAGAVDEVYPEWWGAKSDGSVDSGPAITKAIASTKVLGGLVTLAAGNYLISTAVDMTMIQPLVFQYSTAHSVKVKGKGSRRTYLTGGEAGFGFFELVGSNNCALEGMSMTATGTLQYGILAGRTTTANSSGDLEFTDLAIYGSFSLAAIFALSDEICTYTRVFVYTLAGMGIVLARDVAAYTVTPKYTALLATAPYGGGNGVNRLLGCQVLSISPTALDYLLVVEYPQTFYAENFYTYSEHQTVQILVRKLAHGMTFVGMQQEAGTVSSPVGMLFAADNASPSLPHFRDINFTGCRMFGIVAENGTGISGLNFVGSHFRGAATWQVDVDTLYDSVVRHDNHLISAGSLTPAYRVRTLSSGNDWGTAAPSQTTVPDPTLNRVTTIQSLHLPLNVKDYGAVGNGIADDTPAVVAAFTAANALVRPGLVGTIKHPGATVLIPGGVYSLTTLAAPITMTCNVQSAGATFLIPAAYAGTALLVGHPTSGSILQSANVELPDVVKPTGSAIVAGSVGVKVQNLYSSRLTFGRVSNFETGEWFTGLGEGTVYNEVNVGWVGYCKISMQLKPLAGGWVNQNTYIGGGIQQSSGFAGGTRLTGWRHLVIDGAGINPVNGNTFVGVSFEGDVSEYCVYAKSAYQNTWLGCRYEAGGGYTAVTVSGATLTTTAHGLTTGDLVILTAGVAPVGMAVVTPYYVVATPTADTFNVSRNKGGTAITFGSAGTGVLWARPHRIYYDTAGTGVSDNAILNPANPLGWLDIVHSSAIATGNVLHGPTYDIHDLYAPEDLPMVRARNANSTVAVVRPLIAAYAPATNPTEAPDAWSTALSDRGLLWKAGQIVRTGTGTPEGAVTAPVGSLFLRSDGGANTTLYVKESGAGNAGWVAK